MKMSENTYTFVFALIICVVCSFSLAAVSEGLREKREQNEALDIKKNILKAVVLRNPLSSKAKPEVVEAMYQEKIEELVVDAQGNVVEGKQLKDIAQGEQLYPLYIYQENGKVVSYCFPIEGKGLWSTLYGYFALEPDAITVRGITYYKHGETPGLGAEIEKDWFLNNFKGKKIWDIKAARLVPTTVIKGKVADFISEPQAQYYVDGISGATMTSKGVTAMIDKWLNIYEPFFAKKRGI